ncbi:MAG: 2-C-methyl-D-erythritol 4-phosphate cytidylyltransferase, partial [Pseudomonadota bacterium]
IPKQYMSLDGIPIMVRTLQIFQEHPEIEFIILTAPKGQTEYCFHEFVQPYGITKVRGVAQGGLTRQESVLNGLRLVEDSDHVVIHDSVRPLVKAAVISESIKQAKLYGAAIAACSMTDTVKVGDDFVVRTLSRENLWLAHTPQTFRTKLIMEAHERAAKEGFMGTDDAALIENMGSRVAIVEDSAYNLKITLPEDLLTAERLIKNSRS